jgi:glucose/arabinose dehydrogenase
MAVGLSLLSSCQAGEPLAPDDGITEPDGITQPGVLASGYGIPDGIAVIGEEEFLFAERSGTLHHYVGGEVTEVGGIPASRTVDVAVARFELRDDRARNLEVIYESDDFSIGSRIAWEDASHFFLSFGVGGSPYPVPGPQDLGSNMGKIHRLTADGRIPPDNPLLPGASEPSTIWSYGHRNPQGLHYDAVQQTLYESEHGPMGGDELNIITAGGNYGWPLFSYGLNYDGTPVSDMTEEEAAAVSILPAKFWGPDFRVAPSGLLLVEGSQVPSWTGSFLLGALNPQHLLRYDPATDETEIVLRNVGRVRDVAQLPSGKLLISVDAGSPNPSDSGRIIQLLPGGDLP